MLLFVTLHLCFHSGGLTSTELWTAEKKFHLANIKRSVGVVSELASYIQRRSNAFKTPDKTIQQKEMAILSQQGKCNNIIVLYTFSSLSENENERERVWESVDVLFCRKINKHEFFLMTSIRRRPNIFSSVSYISLFIIHSYPVWWMDVCPIILFSITDRSPIPIQ